MLLPSALSLPCDAQTHATASSKPMRSRLSASTAYQPVHHAPSAATSLLASCRALQAILGSAPMVTPIPHKSAHLQPPSQPKREDHASRQSALRNEWQSSLSFSHGNSDSFNKAKNPPVRGRNKRRRGEYQEPDEDQDMLDTAIDDKENFECIYVTPKRHRKAPLNMPLGLSADDFNALEDPETHNERHLVVSLPELAHTESSSFSSSDDDTTDWTPNDDRLLVETVLEKLKLTKREWNDCARRLGKDKDSLGRRWKMLVVEGNVGLRRGGRVRRTDLDIGSW